MHLDSNRVLVNNYCRVCITCFVSHAELPRFCPLPPSESTDLIITRVLLRAIWQVDYLLQVFNSFDKHLH